MKTIDTNTILIYEEYTVGPNRGDPTVVLVVVLEVGIGGVFVISPVGSVPNLPPFSSVVC